MRKSFQEPWEYDMIVISAEYDDERKGWDYWLKEDSKLETKYQHKVKETDLRRPK